MVKVEEALLSGNYDVLTCQNLIKVISNVPGDSNCAMLFFDTMCKVIYNLEQNDLLESLCVHLLRALVKMTIKVPLLFEQVFEFLEGYVFNQNANSKMKECCVEAMYILSRAYCFSTAQMAGLVSVLSSNPFCYMIMAN